MKIRSGWTSWTQAIRQKRRASNCFASAERFARLSMRIRHARPGDELAIAEVHVSSWRTTYSGILPSGVLENLSIESRRAAWRLRIEDTIRNPQAYALFVAEEGGKLTGFVNGGKERAFHPEFDAELYAIYLVESAQRAGTGSKLTLELLRFFQENGFRKMRVWVLAENPSRQFYERMGGSRCGEKSEKFGNEAFT